MTPWNEVRGRLLRTLRHMYMYNLFRSRCLDRLIKLTAIIQISPFLELPISSCHMTPQTPCFPTPQPGDSTAWSHQWNSKNLTCTCTCMHLRYNSSRVFLNSIDHDLSVDRVSCPERGINQWPSTSTNNHDNTAAENMFSKEILKPLNHPSIHVHSSTCTYMYMYNVP